MSIALKCAQLTMCDKPVAFIDVKGFVYCAPHGEKRKITVPCRKLTTTEIAKLGRGETISYRRTRKVARPSPQPTREQIIALQRYVLKHGREWKSKLSAAWASGADEREPDAGYLRQVRNTFGPSWLVAFKFPESLPPSMAPAVTEAPDEWPITNEQIKAVALAANKAGDRELTQLCLKALGRRPEDADPAARQAVAMRLQVPCCAAEMGCLCAGHARGNDVLAKCDTTEGELCDECGAFIPSTARSMVDSAHDESCSLHPSNTDDAPTSTPCDEIDAIIEQQIAVEGQAGGNGSGALHYLTNGGFDEGDLSYAVGWICAGLNHKGITHQRDDIRERVRAVMERVVKERTVKGAVS